MTHELIIKARKFAEAAHRSIDQKRKYTEDPYIVHPAAVAKLVSGVTDDVDVICAAWLHDVVEDTPVTIEDVHKEFGQRVAALVADLTDISRQEDGNRQARKQIDRDHTQIACAEAKTVKLADLIDNARSITQHDPKFAKTFMQEKMLLLEVLGEGNPVLFAIAQELVWQFYENLDKTT
jgi:(p)ppGpp synthase/HD superfamily hydrolase